MTSIKNLASIIKNGLLSHNEAHRRNLVQADISDSDVQNLRLKIVDPIYQRQLHDYVPLYFSPRNPMLYRRKDLQEDIVILGIDPQILLEPNILFSDGNAAAKGTTFYRWIEMLARLDWAIINARNWVDFEDGKRIKCAEVLVYPRILPERILWIFCRSRKHRETIINIKQGTNIQGLVKPELFF
jgi:ssDNA thymidine ADP-ribosyltransferase, DarT